MTYACDELRQDKYQITNFIAILGEGQYSSFFEKVNTNKIKTLVIYPKHHITPQILGENIQEINFSYILDNSLSWWKKFLSDLDSRKINEKSATNEIDQIELSSKSISRYLYNDENYLEGQIKNEKMKSNIKKAITKSEKIISFKCPKCKKVFKKLNSLQQHQDALEHHLTPFQCSICKAQFRTRDNLEIHTQEKKHKHFRCSVCSKGFLAYKPLNQHIISTNHRVMTGEQVNQSLSLLKKIDQNKTNKPIIIQSHEHEYILDNLREDDSIEICRICRKTRMKIEHEKRQ